jgi:molybdopterin converting factor small subunit
MLSGGYPPAALAGQPASAGPALRTIEELKGKKLQDASDQDIQDFVKNGQAVGVFQPEFSTWIEGKRLTLQQLQEVKGMTLSEFVASMYAGYLAEKAKKLDDADPKTKEKKKKGQPTAGQTFFQGIQQNVSAHPVTSALVFSVAGGFAWSVIKGVASALYGGLVAGPVATSTNTIFEPYTKPLNDRLRQSIGGWISRRRATIAWTQLLTGEASRRKAAKKAADKGEIPKGDAGRYHKPGVSIPDFVADSERFYNEIITADLLWRNATADEQARARQTGFNILFENPKLVGEQLGSSKMQRNSVLTNQFLIYLPPLLKGGATEEEVAQFKSLVGKIHRLETYGDPRHSDLRALRQQLLALIDKWESKGISRAHIADFLHSENEALIASDRIAFILGYVLYTELYFHEYNSVLSGLPQLLAWQEQARQMNGFYDSLRDNKDLVELYFAKKGLKYDVDERLAEQGYPLGGQRKPADVAPLSDPIRHYLETGQRPEFSTAIQPAAEIRHGPEKSPEDRCIVDLHKL